jgi:Bacterial Ig domain/Calcineurin-like phosphoesterase
MRTKRVIRKAWVLGFAGLAALGALHDPATAGKPHSAYYSPDPSRVFWFIHVSDTHVGASGSTDTDNLSWLVNTARTVINPSFIVATGDLTDSTNGNFLGIPNGPYQAEWNTYRSIITGAMPSDFASMFYDIPGNHDAYSDKNFAYYLNNSIQGRATGQKQLSWRRDFTFGKYHFLGVNSADNTGAAFSLSFPYGDHAGLDADELAFIHDQLAANTDAELTLVFAHHPIFDTGASDDTWLFYGQQQFTADLGNFGVSEYGYGHTHDFSEALFDGNSYTGGDMPGDGVLYFNLASLGKSSSNQLSVVAVDCNGLSTVTQAVRTWPIVLITAPVNNTVGASPNPYAYTVPNSPTNPIRALVFDQGAVTQVRFRVDGAATWYPMTRNVDNTKQWQGTWNASAVTNGSHTIEVQATGSTVRSDIITVTVAGGNSVPVARADSYTTQQDVALSATAPGVLGNDTDADGDALTASLTSGPANGTLTLNASGSFVYTPNSGFFGTDSFVYTASDSKGGAATATVTITVSASKDSVTITKAAFSTRAKQLTVQAKSTAAPNAVLTVSVDGANYGSMAYNKKTKVYSFVKAFSVAPGSVTVTSSKGGSATSTVTTVK